MSGACRGKRGARGFLAVAVSLACGAVSGLASADGPASKPPLHASFPTVATTLPNGLRLVVSEDHTRPLVAMLTCYGVGTNDDPPGKTGLAELVAKVLETSSTRHLARSDRVPLAFAMGVDTPSTALSTQTRSTCSNITAPKTALPLLLWLESDRMGFASDGVTSTAIGEARKSVDEAVSYTHLTLPTNREV